MNIKCSSRFILGADDVTEPTRDIVTTQTLDTGLRFFGLVPLQKWATTTAATIGTQGYPTSSFGMTPTDEAGAQKQNAGHDVPLAIGKRAEVWDICNINTSPIMIQVEIFGWKNGANYETVDLSSEVDSVGSRHELYHKTDDSTWAALHFNQDWKNANSSSLNHSSIFGRSRNTASRELVRRLVKHRTVVIPAGGIYRFKVYFRRLYPLEIDDLLDLRYSWKALADKCVHLRWKSMCGVVPTALATDPTYADIHTEKPMLAVTRRLDYTARFYFKTYVTTIVSTETQHGPGTVAIPAKTATNRAEKPARNVVFTGVADPVHT